MIPINKIYISGFKYDIHWTRICVASIRYYYPDIPVVLLKDEMFGPYDTDEIEKNWGVSVFDAKIKKFGWGFSKLEPLFIENKERYLVIDSDIICVGQFIDLLQKIDADFVVRPHYTKTDEQKAGYYDSKAINQLIDPEFKHPGFAFNTGQIVATSGIFKRNDFQNLLSWNPYPSLAQKDIFKYGEQGLMNYFLFMMHQNKKISLKTAYFMELGNNPQVNAYKIEELKNSTCIPLIIHWAGIRKNHLKDNANWRLLQFFENYYYSKIPAGNIKQRTRPHFKEIKSKFKLFLKKILNR